VICVFEDRAHAAEIRVLQLEFEMEEVIFFREALLAHSELELLFAVFLPPFLREHLYSILSVSFFLKKFAFESEL
jgi:hypothetical protein